MSRRRRALGALLGAALALAGCASIPDSGPVRPGQDSAVALDEPPVRVLPPPPRPGAGPEDVVRGFLLASASPEDDRASARAYLAPETAQDWRPQAGARVYESGTLRIARRGASVTLTAQQVAAIGPDGRYVPEAEPVLLRTRFSVQQVGGEWRIDGLEPGLLHTTFDVERTYRTASVYFLDPSGRTVVPDLLALPVRSSMATALTQRLLEGPSDWLAPAVRTAVPAGTALAVASVPVVGGVAQVDLTEEAFGAGSEERQALSAQIVWTLRQLDEVRSVRISVEGGEYAVPGVAGEQSRDSWPGFDPGALPEDADAAVVRDGVLGRLEGEGWVAVAGEAGTGGARVREPALSLAGDVAAVLSPDRRRLLRGALTPDAPLVPVLTGGDLAEPSWDRYGHLWSVDRADGTVRVAAADGAPVAVAVPSGLRVVGVRVARDGARALLLVRRGQGYALLVGAVVRGGGEVPLRVVGPVVVAPEVVDVRDVAWVDDGRVAVLGVVEGEGRQVRVVDVSGWDAVPTGPVDAVSVAAAPDRPVLVGTPDGQVLRAAGRSWTAAGPGADPAYPG
ncbi:LpqB family beta-propeller domain-containing protein [Vallicoccus soli]|uniref:GerMN domain-containing protein n=1 Tax=Vallicoccus soli TaxID=2339232 RepID=A0A3A3ZIQ4_9ACTN|nr:LpqB family beta-propeller domain-containing protein [Vallicoccus soli]RJK95406.1 hypothetical protein D5H78_12165 [Vallicoccus soli]